MASKKKKKKFFLRCLAFTRSLFKHTHTHTCTRTRRLTLQAESICCKMCRGLRNPWSEGRGSVCLFSGLWPVGILGCSWREPVQNPLRNSPISSEKHNAVQISEEKTHYFELLWKRGGSRLEFNIHSGLIVKQTDQYVQYPWLFIDTYKTIAVFSWEQHIHTTWIQWCRQGNVVI